MKKKVIKGYKATDNNLKCNNFQYEIDRWHEVDEAKLCSTGLHFCENPLDILNYYDLTNSRFFVIEADEVSDERREEDTKRVAKKIKLKTEIKLPKLIDLSFGYINEQCNKQTNDKNIISDDIDSSKVATSGYSSKVALNGSYSVGMCVGKNSVIKGKKGDWITLAEWKYIKNICKVIPICVKSAQIDGKILKEDTWYTLKDSEFVEVKESDFL